MKDEAKSKVKMIQDVNWNFEHPMVFSSRGLFNICCLGLVKIGTPALDGSFNGRYLVDIGNKFFAAGFTNTCIQSVLGDGDYLTLNIYFKFKYDENHPRKNSYDDEEDDHFLVSINRCSIKFSRSRGEVWSSTKRVKNKYSKDTGEELPEGSDVIEHPFSKEGFDKMFADIVFNIDNRDQWW